MTERAKTVKMIRKDLLDEALHCAVTIGMRKTSVKQLTEAADIKAARYHNDEVHIRQILEPSGLAPRGGVELATATIRGLILTVSHQDEIGSLYPQVLKTLVRDACKELFG